MPFSDVRGSVAIFLQRLSDRDFFKWKLRMDRRIAELLEGKLFPPRQPIGQMEPCRILPCHNTRTSWRTNMAGRMPFPPL